MFCFRGYSRKGRRKFAVKFTPDSLLLGQPFTVKVTLELREGSSARTIEMPLENLKPLYRMNQGDDSTAVPFEIVDYGNWESAENNKFEASHLKWKAKKTNGLELYENILKIVIWEPGVFYIPATSAEVTLNNGKYDLLSQEQAIKVDIPHPDQIAKIDSSGIAAMKPIIRTAPESILFKVLAGLLAVLFVGRIDLFFLF